MRRGLHWCLSLVLVGLLIAAGSSHFHVRPHLATMVLLGCTYAFLCDFEGGRVGMWRLLWLAPIFVVWTNVHGGMLGGLGTVGVAIAGWGLAKVIGTPTPVSSQRQLLPLAGIALVCALTALVNPYGWLMPKTWFEIMDSPILPQIIQEHSRLSPWRLDGAMVLLLGALYAFVLAGVLPKWPRVTWLIPLVWLCLAGSRIRHAPLFAITAGIALADMLPYTRWARWLARPGSDLFRFSDAVAPRRGLLDWRPTLAPALIVVISIGLQAARVPVPVLGHGWAQFEPDDSPNDVLAGLQQFQPRSGPTVPIFNEYHLGGFLIYHTYFTEDMPAYRVFVDDRCELYGDKWLQDYVTAETHDTMRQIQDWERRYGVFERALTKPGSGFDRYFRSSADWTAGGRPGAGACLYVKKGSGSGGLLRVPPVFSLHTTR